MYKRKLNRLYGYNYSWSGAYFITVCLEADFTGKELFGKVIDGKIVLNSSGIIAENIWKQIPDHYRDVHLDEYCIMPDHIHGILWIGQDYYPDRTDRTPRLSSKMDHPPCCTDRTPRLSSSEPPHPPKEKKKSYGRLSKIISAYKNIVLKEIAKEKLKPFVWKRSYYDHIIRNEKGLNLIREYIKRNPENWGVKDDYEDFQDILDNY